MLHGHCAIPVPFDFVEPIPMAGHLVDEQRVHRPDELWPGKLAFAFKGGGHYFRRALIDAASCLRRVDLLALASRFCSSAKTAASSGRSLRMDSFQCCCARWRIAL